MPCGSDSGIVKQSTGRFRRTVTILPGGFPGWLRGICCAVLVLLLANTGYALDPERTLTQAFLRKWQPAHGLPQATVLKLFQSADDRLWIGTQLGLYRFDGLRFQAVRPLTGPRLDLLWIQDLAESADGTLWVSTHGGGLIRYRDNMATLVQPDAQLHEANLSALLLDQSGDLWVGSDNGLYRLHDSSLTRVDPVSSLLPEVRALCETGDGRIWMGGTGSRIVVWEKDQFTPRTLTSIPEDAAVTALLPNPDGTLWIGTTAGLIHLNGSEERLETRDTGLADTAVEALANSEGGGIWVGTRDGISRLTSHGIESLRARDGLSQSTACSLLVDREGGLWVGTKNGLNQFIDRRVIPLTTNEGLGTNDTGPIIRGDDGTVWIATIGAGLGTYDGRLCKMKFHKDNGLPSENLYAMTLGKEGEIWIGTDEGLCALKGGSIVSRLSTEDGIPSNQIQVLSTDQQGTLWIGTSQGLVTWNGSEVHPAVPDSLVSEASIRFLLPLDSGRMLVSTDQGVFEAEGSTLHPLLFQGQRLPHVVTAIQTDDGNLWLGTRDRGLVLSRPTGETFRFSLKHGLYDDEILGLAMTDAGELWLACGRGVFVVDKKELLQCAAGEVSRVTSQPFTPTESLRTIECQRDVQPVINRTPDGRIWVATNYGVLIFDPSIMVRKLPPPVVLLDGLMTNGVEMAPDPQTDSLFLSPGLANIAVRYITTSYVIPQRTQFRYRLQGFDDNWVDAETRREAFYTNLPAAQYRFQVQARHPQGEWGEITSSVCFQVPPHFYETWWFVALMGAAVVLCVWGVYRLRMTQLRTQFLAVMAERLRIARELHDTLLQGFSGITMQMQALSNRLAPSPEQNALKDVIADAGHCLREARRTVAGLRNAPGETRLSIAISQAARQAVEQNGLQLSLNVIDLKQSLSMEVEYHLLRIAQEAISNTIKHAGARVLTVTLDQVGRQLKMVIADDGRGFSFQGEHVRTPGHYGLIGMRERAHQIHASLQVITNPGHGTTIQLEMPLPAAPARDKDTGNPQ